MDHDLKSLQAFMEAKFGEVARRQDDCLQLIATTTDSTNAKVDLLGEKVDTTNGRVQKAEVAIAVLKFAVYTIGGALLVAAMQVVIGRLTGGQ